MSSFNNTIRRSTNLLIHHVSKSKAVGVGVSVRVPGNITPSSSVLSTTASWKESIYQNEYKKVQEQQTHVNQLITSIKNNLVVADIVVDQQQQQQQSQTHTQSMYNTNKVIGQITEKSGGFNYPMIGVGYQALNRNARKPRRANHGKRPCSRIARRAKRSKNGNSRRK